MKSGIHSTETIVAGLTSRSTAKFAAAFEAAQALGDQGEKYFAEAWPHLDGYRKVSVAASLGSSRGDHGLAILREGIRTTGPKSTDVVCASLYALAKREGRDANDLLDNAYRDLRSFFARHYAEIGLAAVGDDRTWDLMLARLSKRLLVKKRMDATPPEIATPLAYLLRHSTNHTDRLNLVRRSGGSPVRIVLMDRPPGDATSAQLASGAAWRSAPSDSAGCALWRMRRYDSKPAGTIPVTFAERSSPLSQLAWPNTASSFIGPPFACSSLVVRPTYWETSSMCG